MYLGAGRQPQRVKSKTKNTGQSGSQSYIVRPRAKNKQKSSEGEGYTYATVMQASLTTWDLRSLADSLSAPSNKRKCWKKQSYCAAPATSSDLIFLS